MHGDLDIATSPLVCEDLLCLGMRHPGEGVAVEMSGVTFMDCCALGALVQVRKTLHGRLGIHLPSSRVQRFLHLADMTDALPTLSDRTVWRIEAKSRIRSMS